MTFYRSLNCGGVVPRGNPCRNTARSSVGRGRRDRSRQKCMNFRAALGEMIDRNVILLNDIYGVEIPKVNTEGLTCKEMVDAFKEWTVSKLSRASFRRLGRRERVGGRFALLLLKKQLPPPCGCFPSQRDAWAERQSLAVEPALPDGFMAFVTREVKKMFPFGWDRGYVDEIARSAPPSSACVEATVKQGGARSVLDLDEYLAGCIGESRADLFSEHYENPLVYKEVPTAGKVRPLTVTPSQYNVLRPLHKTIFGVVSRQRWSLVGPPNPKSFRRAGFRFKSGLLSGDYAGATDSLRLDVVRTILNAMFSTASIVPEQVKERALAALAPLVKLRQQDPPEKWVWVRRGTMMGSLLSFPLLCLYNRVCALWTLGQVPMLINGDDLAAETCNPEPWFDTLPLLGLQPERSKTGYSTSTVEINSTPFVVKRRGGCAIAPVCRTRVLAPKNETAVVGGQMKEFLKGLTGQMRRRAARLFLQAKFKRISKALYLGLSLADLGFEGQYDVSELVKNKITDLARNAAQSCPSSIPPPASHQIFVRPNGDPVTSGALCTVYDGTNEDAKRFKRYERISRCGDLFGSTVKEYCNSAEVVSRWWDDLVDASSSAVRPLNLSVSRSRLLYGGGAPLKPPPACAKLHHGEPMSVRAFERRLLNRILESHTPKLRLTHAYADKLPAVVRWGISSGGCGELVGE
uniref:RNA-dependent RNA polymerase n=1 Tax=Hulunbuir Botou tick virus 5 TaxID=2972064 RepID=A0A9E7V210_9VIRU|nr:MAG: RNA-dependent RNA polymerase [Hulunbuir Botou tick virus 5]